MLVAHHPALVRTLCSRLYLNHRVTSEHHHVEQSLIARRESRLKPEASESIENVVLTSGSNERRTTQDCDRSHPSSPLCEIEHSTPEPPPAQPSRLEHAPVAVAPPMAGLVRTR